MSLNRGMGTENVVTYIMEYYSAIKNNELMKFLGKWVELRNVILSFPTIHVAPLHTCTTPNSFPCELRKPTPWQSFQTAHLHSMCRVLHVMFLTGSPLARALTM